MVGLFDTNVVTEIFGTGTASDVVYVIVGIAGLAMVPRLLEDLRLGAGRTPPRAPDTRPPGGARPGRRPELDAVSERVSALFAACPPCHREAALASPVRCAIRPTT